MGGEAQGRRTGPASAPALLAVAQSRLGDWVAGTTQQVAAVVITRTEHVRGLEHRREQVPKTQGTGTQWRTRVADSVWDRGDLTVLRGATTSLTHTGTLRWASGCSVLAEGSLAEGGQAPPLQVLSVGGGNGP